MGLGTQLNKLPGSTVTLSLHSTQESSEPKGRKWTDIGLFADDGAGVISG